MNEFEPPRTDGERLAAIELLLIRFDKELFGNGQPGRLKLGEDRIAVLEKKESRYAGALWVIGSITAILGAAIGGHLGKVW